MKKENESSMQKLSKEEMKKIMGGLIEPQPKCSGSCDFTWKDYNGDSHTTPGTCMTTTNGLCYCDNGEGYCAG